MICNDEQKLNYILGHPSVYDASSDDGCTAKTRYKLGTLALQKKDCLFLMPNQYSLFMVRPLNNFMFECHVAILPEGRGEPGVAAGREAASWVFKKTKCKKLICFIPEFNLKAKIYAMKIGFREEGYCKQSFCKRDKLYNQILFGLSKPKGGK